MVDDLRIDWRALQSLLDSAEADQVVFEAAEDLAQKASDMSGRNFKAVKSKNPNRASAAVLGDDLHAIRSDNKHAWLRKSLG